MDPVYRPGYGHLAASFGPCWAAHDLCLYALDIASALWSVLYLQPGRAPGLVSAQAEYQARMLPALAAQLGRRDHPLRPPPPPERAMTDYTLRQALGYAARGWPVFPCQAGRKIPATAHGYRDASTDPGRLPTGSFATPGPTWRSPPAPRARRPGRRSSRLQGAGFSALIQLRDAGLLDGAAACVRTPGGGMHVYFAGSGQRNGHLPACHLDFLAGGGYVLAPPSTVGGKPYLLLWELGGRGGLDWAAATRLLQPQHQLDPPAQHLAASRDLSHLAGSLSDDAVGVHGRPGLRR